MYLGRSNTILHNFSFQTFFCFLSARTSQAPTLLRLFRKVEKAQTMSRLWKPLIDDHISSWVPTITTMGSSHHTVQGGDGQKVQIIPKAKTSLCEDAGSQKGPVPPWTERPLPQEERGGFLQMAQ